MNGEMKKQKTSRYPWLSRILAVVALCLVLGATSVTVMAAPAYASDGGTLETLTGKISNQFNEIYTQLGIILTAAATVAIGICAFKWIFGSDPQSVRTAKTWLLYIVIGLAIYWLAGTIVSTVQNMVQ